METQSGISYNGILVSKRTIIPLEPAEKDFLGDYLKRPGAFSTISLNTGVSYVTIVKLNENGKGQVGTVLKIRDFITSFKEAK